MNTLGVFSTLRVYHDECGGYHECGDITSVGDIMSTVGVQLHWGHIMYMLGDTKMLVGVIMSTLRDTMSTPGGVQYTGGIP